MKTIMNNILATCIMCLAIGTLSAQDTLRRANVTNGGGWLSKSGFTLYGSFGQPGVAANLVSEDGSLAGSAGFIGPVVNIGQNNPPVASSNEFPVFVGDSLIQLQGFDPDDDAITYEITGSPELGTLTLVEGEEFRFMPNAGLNPGQLYNDQITYRVNDGNLNSNEATWRFQFIIEDTPQVITGLTFSSNTLGLTWTDAVPNADYEVSIEYYDLPNATFKELLVKESYAAGDVGNSATEFALDLAVSETENPYLSSGDVVLVFVLVNPNGGEGTAEVFELNTANGRVETSEDGAFFAFGTDQIVRENGDVSLSLYGAELGGFDISTSIVEILNEGSKGTITTPTNVSTSDILKEWSFTYQSTEQVGGMDSIQFRVFSQARQEFDTAWVRVEVVDVNDPPKLAKIANQVTNEDTPIQVNIAPVDPDNEISVLVESNEQTLVPAAYENGVITISPGNNFSGSASVNVIVSEVGTEENYVAYRRFNVEVLDVDDAPIVAALPDVSVDEDNALTFVATASDVDATLAVFSYRVEVSDPSAFEVEINGNTIRLIPLKDVNGDFQVTVFADDGLGKPTSVSAGEVFDLTVNAVNDEPEIIQNFGTQQVITGLPDYTIDLAAYFTDVESGSDLTYSFEGNTEIDLTLSETILTVAPTDAFNSSEDVTIVASDGEFEVRQTLTFVYIQASANIIVANAVDNISLAEDFVSSTLNVSSVFANTNDSNATFAYNLSGGGFINATISSAGVITFSSKENFSGTETFYLFGSVGSDANFTSFTVEVTPVNDAPVIGSLESKEVLEDQVLSGVFLSVSDVDNSLSELSLDFTSSNEAVLSTGNITSSVLSSGISLSINPSENANGMSTVGIIVGDGEFSDTVSFNLNVLPVNDDPIATATALTDATEDVSYSIDLSTLFSDVDGDNLSFTVVESPSWLTTTGNTLAGTPSNDDVGSQSLQVRVDDSNGGAIAETYQVTVINVNDAPVLVTEIAALNLFEDFGTSTFALDTRFEDVDGDNLAFTASSDNEGVVTVAIEGSTLTLTEVGNGSATINIAANDGNGGTVETTFSVTVNNVNDAPEVVSAVSNQEVDGGFQSTTIDLSGAFTDEDGDALTYEAISSNTAIVTVAISGSTLSLNEVGPGTATITVTGSDGNGGSSSFTFDFTVLPVELGVGSVVEYSIYPNPVSEKLYIKGVYNQLSWKLIDTSGRVIQHDAVKAGQPIDVSTIKTGIYYLMIEETGKSLKVIIR